MFEYSGTFNIHWLFNEAKMKPLADECVSLVNFGLRSNLGSRFYLQFAKIKQMVIQSPRILK